MIFTSQNISNSFQHFGLLKYCYCICYDIGDGYINCLKCLKPHICILFVWCTIPLNDLSMYNE